jgi:hypothetical protein
MSPAAARLAAADSTRALPTTGAMATKAPRTLAGGSPPASSSRAR